jgi:type IX secretion system PorP/SprF family membrane protein
MRTINLITLLFIACHSYAQQLPVNTQFYNNTFLINPATTGSKDIHLLVSTRQQWVGFKGAPSSYRIAGHSNLRNDKFAVGGFLFLDDFGGAIKQTGIGLNFRYRYDLNENSSLAIGSSALFNQYAYDGSSIIANSSNDQLLFNQTNSLAPDLNLGIAYRYKGFQLGISSQQLFQSSLKKLNTLNNASVDKNRLIRHYNLTLNYEYTLKNQISILPYFLIRSTFIQPLQFELGSNIKFQKYFHAGVSYRSSDAVSLLIGFEKDKFGFFYSYDVTTSKLRNYSSGSHEITVSYKFSNQIDSDGDGVSDKKDECPTIKGERGNKGCPWGDRDSDGVNDNEDKCPEVAGDKENNGCPWGDKDGDGVKDNLDKCPSVSGPISNFGCPVEDNDGDGVPNSIDKCPETKGEKENDGCPKISEKQKEIVSKAIENLEFETNSSVILKSSLPALDMLALLLSEKPEWILKLVGHTDNIGDDGSNMELSRKRAEAVRDYLVSKGLNFDRFKVEYYGESRPIETNDTPEGRKKNRRVEMIIEFK